MNLRLLPVGAFVCLLRDSLELDPMYSDLWLEGEVTDAHRSSAGHVYFSLGDQDGCLKCVLFRNAALRLNQPIQVGDEVAVHGRLSIYPRSGSLQMIADLLSPAGQGIGWLELEALRHRLDAEGLFDERRKRPLPEWPRTIGVVTSAHGAAWHDIQTVVRRRYPLASLILSPAQVQGAGSAESIVEAIRAIQDGFGADVIILARGGGASDDLAAFNDERVVRTVFAASVPVVTGVGHATDRTLVEDVADAFAPTPSAAAELCVPSTVYLDQRLKDLDLHLSRSIARRMSVAKSACNALDHQLATNNPSPLLLESARTVSEKSYRLQAAMTGGILKRRDSIAAYRTVLNALDPAAVLRRGYAILQHSGHHQPVYSVTRVSVGDSISARLDDGVLVLAVEGAGSPTSLVNAPASV